MFGLFRPCCPCDSAAKAWIEKRLRWLSEQFEDSAFSGLPVVLPTSHFFPDHYDGSEAAVRRMLNRVCHYMEVDPDQVLLKIVSRLGKVELVNNSGQQMPGAVGTYRQVGENVKITLDVTELDRPMDLVGTMAHELAHHRLLGERRIKPSVYDNELLTDLTVVFMGLGIFLANSPRAWRGQLSKWPGTTLNKPEYMTAPMYAYALAHLAWFRNEPRPAWAKHLRWHFRPEFKQALRFLRETRDSSFQPGETAGARSER